MKIEDALSEMEALFSPILRKVRDNESLESLSKDEYFLFLQNIMLQKSRTLSARRNREEFNNLITKSYAEAGIHKDTSKSDEEKKELTGFLE